MTKHQPTSPSLSGPPARTKIAAGLAILACAGACLLPFLIAAGVLTSAGAALTRNLLATIVGLLVVAGGVIWWQHRRRAAASGCGDGSCAC